MADNFLNFMKAFYRVASNCWLVTGLGQAPKGGQPRLAGGVINAPTSYLFATVLSAVFSILGPRYWSLAGLVGLVVWPALAVMHFELSGATWAEWRDQVRNAVGGRAGRGSA